MEEINNIEEKVEKQEEEQLSIVEEARKVRDEIKAENDRRESILKKEQDLRAEQMLAGTGGGHQEVKQLSDKDYAQKALRGGY